MPNSYSKLIKEINSNKVDSLILIPSRREVIVNYKNGIKSVVPVFYKDQKLIETALSTNTPLMVNNYKAEMAYASLISNFGFLIIFFVALTFLLKRVSKIINSSFLFKSPKQLLVPSDKLQTKFDDIAGLNEPIQELKDVVRFITDPEKLKNLGGKPPKGILLSGQPGTGKTLLARALACEAGVPFYSISASEFIELFVGVGASRVRELFKQAKQTSPSIVFIDEIDAIGRQRGVGLGIGNDEQEQTLNQLLKEMDGFDENSGVIVLGATNRINVIDSALKRPGRFDQIIELLLPDVNDRSQILGIHSRSIPLNDKVSLKNWAIRTPGFSGAELRNLLNEAAIYTARKNEQTISNSNIEHAYERISIGMYDKTLLNEKRKLLIAYRVASKALVAFLISYPEQLDKISLLPANNGQLGYIRFLTREEIIDRNYETKSYLKSKIMVLLASRAAETLIYGEKEITQLSKDELFSVEKIARNMIEKYGFYNSNLLYIEKNNNNFILGKSFRRSKRQYSEKTIMRIDHAIKKIAKQALNDCIKILTDNRPDLDLIAYKLIKEETLTSKEFYLILSSNNIKPI
tara:strand:+ start:3723 stop:5453 length:1731 start_codon:yes stop_codon:yes gene_type:complete